MTFFLSLLMLVSLCCILCAPLLDRTFHTGTQLRKVITTFGAGTILVCSIGILAGML
ncbi:MAG: hypothetical protein ACOX7F_07450 [Eubacteriales bacterium]|jgi:hypothetical protein